MWYHALMQIKSIKTIQKSEVWYDVDRGNSGTICWSSFFLLAHRNESLSGTKKTRTDWALPHEENISCFRKLTPALNTQNHFPLFHLHS